MDVLSLNVWGAPYAKHRQARMQAIVAYIEVLKPDVVLFQEAYLAPDRTILTEGLKAILPYQHYFPSGLVGSGLLTVSAYPIVNTAFQAFSMQGKPEDITRGDYYARKGIALTRLDTPEGILDVYNCHTHAQYEPDNDNEYAVYNETNLYEAARFLDAQSGATPALLAGDLNTRPDQAGYRIITQLGSLVDARHQLTQTHTPTYRTENPYTGAADQCLDYVLVRNIGVDSVRHVMTETLSGEAEAYSDHDGVWCAVRLHGDTLNVYEADCRVVLSDLQTRVAEASVDTRDAQLARLGRGLLAAGSLLDGALVSAFIGRYSKTLARMIRWFGFIFTIGYAVWQLIQAGINLQARRAILEGLQAEIETQLASGRLFDGRELRE
ncbi:MAG: endonuclease/exonuclease/phosphatase family protein [Chloroflexota bacterium]